MVLINVGLGVEIEPGQQNGRRTAIDRVVDLRRLVLQRQYFKRLFEQSFDMQVGILGRTAGLGIDAHSTFVNRHAAVEVQTAQVEVGDQRLHLGDVPGAVVLGKSDFGVVGRLEVLDHFERQGDARGNQTPRIVDKGIRSAPAMVLETEPVAAGPFLLLLDHRELVGAKLLQKPEADTVAAHLRSIEVRKRTPHSRINIIFCLEKGLRSHLAVPYGIEVGTGRDARQGGEGRNALYNIFFHSFNSSLD